MVLHGKVKKTGTDFLQGDMTMNRTYKTIAICSALALVGSSGIFARSMTDRALDRAERHSGVTREQERKKPAPKPRQDPPKAKPAPAPHPRHDPPPPPPPAPKAKPAPAPHPRHAPPPPPPAPKVKPAPAPRHAPPPPPPRRARRRRAKTEVIVVPAPREPDVIVVAPEPEPPKVVIPHGSRRERNKNLWKKNKKRGAPSEEARQEPAPEAPAAK